MIHDNLRRWRQQGKLLFLLDTLILCLRFQSTQEVDRIFAMLGIISETDRASLSIQPNYNMDKETVFQQAAWRLLVSCDLPDQFRLLRFAGVGRSRNLRVPSWVPDSTAGLLEFVLEPRSTASNFRASSMPPKMLCPKYEWLGLGLSRLPRGLEVLFGAIETPFDKMPTSFGYTEGTAKKCRGSKQVTGIG